MQVSGLSNVTSVAIGRSFAIALEKDGTVWTWGSNSSGQLGDGSTVDHLNPLQVPGLSGVVCVAAGSTHSVAVKNDGTVWVWGDNSGCQLADGYADYIIVPQPVLGFEQLSIAKARANGNYVDALSCVITGKFDDCIYIQDPEKLCGIKVVPAPSDAEIGKLINVQGTLTTVDGERAISLTDYQLQTESGSITPIGMPNQSLGGGDFMFYQPTGEGQEGVFGWQLIKNELGKYEFKWQKMSGVNNIGLLVKVWGTVKEIEDSPTSAWFKISEGSPTDVKVSVPSGISVPDVGDFISVTGISSCELSGTELLRLVRVRQQSDIQ